MSGRGDPTMREYPVGLLNQRYLVVLVLVAFLVLLNQILVQPPLLQLTTDAPVINIAGRQRMLSQRLAKAALALGGAADEVDRRRHRAELGHVLRLWSVSHNGLRHGDRALSLPGRNSPAVREAFDDLEPFFTRICAAVARLIGNDAHRRPDDAAAHEDLATILEEEIRCQFIILAREEIRCQFIVLARKDELTPDFHVPTPRLPQGFRVFRPQIPPTCIVRPKSLHVRSECPKSDSARPFFRRLETGKRKPRVAIPGGLSRITRLSCTRFPTWAGSPE